MTTLALAIGLLVALGCSSGDVFPQDDIMQMSNREYTGTQFRTLGLIAGDDSQGTISMTGRIRNKLEGAGLTVLRTPGRWEGEPDAVRSLCSMQNPSPDGVIFVRWDRVNLRACDGEHYPNAFEAEGDYVGVDKLADRLLQYLEVQGEEREVDSQQP